MIASFIVSGAPVPKKRPRVTMRGGFARAYTPKVTVAYEALVAEQARHAMGGIDAYAGPVELEAHFSLPIPKSWPKRDQRLAVAGMIQPDNKADIDNLFKSLADGLNGIVFADDSQIVSARITKRYGEEPGVAVTVRAI